METRPEKAVELAVKGMLPKNKIGDASFGRLKVYRGPEHKQQAQQPVVLEVK
jgi:large subunit ribosomal protein L13